MLYFSHQTCIWSIWISMHPYAVWSDVFSSYNQRSYAPQFLSLIPQSSQRKHFGLLRRHLQCLLYPHRLLKFKELFIILQMVFSNSEIRVVVVKSVESGRIKIGWDRAISASVFPGKLSSALVQNFVGLLKPKIKLVNVKCGWQAQNIGF